MSTLIRFSALYLMFGLTGCDLMDDLPIGKGYSAKHLCSFIFTSGLDEDLVRDTFIAPKVEPLPWIWDLAIDAERKTVQVKDIIFGEGAGSATAVYRPGKGCTLLVDQPVDAVNALPFAPLTPPTLPADEAWPYGASNALSRVPGVDIERLQDTLDVTFSEPPGATVLTTAVVVAYQGQLIAERYALGVTRETLLPGWSMTKTITGTLAGILVDDGTFKLNAPAPVPGWSDTEKDSITLQHLLHMSSGLEVNEDYSGFSDVTQMLYRESDQYAYAVNQPVVMPPYTEFKYSTAETNRLAAAIQSAVGGTQQAVYEFYQQRLFHAINIIHAIIEFDASGNFVGGAYGYMPARDWARIGQLYLQKGRWNDNQVLSEDWVSFATSPSPVAKHYGAHMWLNSDGQRWPNVPYDAFSLVGHQGQRVVIIPSRELVVVRTGVTEDRDLQNQVMNQLLEGILSALPQGHSL